MQNKKKKSVLIYTLEKKNNIINPQPMIFLPLDSRFQDGTIPPSIHEQLNSIQCILYISQIYQSI
jgi:hypothetical protein